MTAAAAAKARRRAIIEKYAVHTALGKIALCRRCARLGTPPKIVYPSRGAAKQAANEMVHALDGPEAIYVQRCWRGFSGGWHHTQRKVRGRNSQKLTVRRPSDDRSHELSEVQQ